MSYSDSHRRSYITTGAFDDEIFSYVVSQNAQFVTVGTLTALGTKVPRGLNGPGVILRENGRKLYPGANPGVNTYMVGVYNEDIGSGFIDPNAHVFAVYSGSKPYTAADGVDPSTSERDWSAPVYTRGTVYAQGDIATDSNLYVSSIATVYGDLVVGGDSQMSGNLSVGGNIDLSGNVVAGKQIRSSTVTNYPVTAPSTIVTIDPTLGQVHKISISGSGTVSTIVTSVNNVPGAMLYTIVRNTTGGNLGIDFNASFLSENAGNFTINNGTTSAFSFVSDGSNFYQVGKATVISQ